MGIGDGDRVIGRVENGALIIEPVAAAVRRAQALVAKHALARWRPSGEGRTGR